MKLTSNNIDEFSARFCSCSDGLVFRLEMRLSRDGTKSVIISIQAKEQSGDSEDWVELEFCVSKVQHYRFAQTAKEQFQVLSDGIQVGFFGETVYFDLAPYSDEPDCEDDFLRSNAYCAGSEVSWRIVS